MASNCDSHWYIKELWEFWINIDDDSIIKVRVVFPHKSDNHDMVRVILLMKMTTNAVVTWSAFSITDENSGNKALKNPGLKINNSWFKVILISFWCIRVENFPIFLSFGCCHGMNYHLVRFVWLQIQTSHLVILREGSQKDQYNTNTWNFPQNRPVTSKS